MLFVYLLCLALRDYNSTQLSMTFRIAIDVNIICQLLLTFISMIISTSESFKAWKVFMFQNLRFYEQLKFHDLLSCLKKSVRMHGFVYYIDANKSEVT